MEKTPPGSKPRPRREAGVDDDGVRVTRAPRSRRRMSAVEWIASAAIAAGIVAAFAMSDGDAGSEPAERTPPAAAGAPHRGDLAQTAGRAPQPGETAQAARRLPSARPKSAAGEAPAGTHAAPASGATGGNGDQAPIDTREYIEALRAAGETGGIAAYPPPGTSPPLSGIVVPEGYRLPEGYVRHFQTTDDGEQLEPILMFSPDYEFLDAAGNPMAIPKNRVVPPEMAPPDLPLRTLVVPETER